MLSWYLADSVVATGASPKFLGLPETDLVAISVETCGSHHQFRCGGEQSARIGMSGLVGDLFGVADLYDLSPIHHRDARARDSAPRAWNAR